MFTAEEVKEFTSEISILAGPNDKGKMFERPGELFDFIKQPYDNPEQAAAANNGKAPPNLCLITKGRVGGEDYLFALLTGYYDANEELHRPYGVDLGEDSFWNPYFSGGVIAMRPPLCTIFFLIF